MDTSRDPAPPAQWPRWGFGGGGERRRGNRRRSRCTSPMRNAGPRHVQAAARQPNRTTQQRKRRRTNWSSLSAAPSLSPKSGHLHRSATVWFYGGRPASRKASVNVCATEGGRSSAAHNSDELKDGCSVSTCLAAALASSVRPSFASAAAKM